MKSQINIRASALLQRQLKELTAHLGTSITETVSIAIDRMHKQETQTMKYNYTTGTKGSVISLETGRYADTVEGDTSEKMDAHTALAQMLDEVERPGWTATDETLSDFTPQQLREYVGAE